MTQPAPPAPAPAPPAPPAPAPAPPTTPPPAPAPPAPPAAPGTFRDAETGEVYAFPAETPLTAMDADQKAEYWRHKSRKHENTVKGLGDIEDLKRKAARADELEAANATEQEKAVKAAEERVRKEERDRTAPALVDAHFRAAAKGVLTSEQATALLEDLDLSKYLTVTGEVDLEKVEKKVAAFAPAAPGTPGARRFPDLGQGPRAGAGKPSVATGREMFEQRRGKKSTDA